MIIGVDFDGTCVERDRMREQIKSLQHKVYLIGDVDYR